MTTVELYEEAFTLYNQALAADAAFTEACRVEYGAQACNMRYAYNQPAHIASLAATKNATFEAYREAIRLARKSRDAEA